MKFKNETLAAFINWMGKDGLRWFEIVHMLKGSYSCVLNLNYKKKRIPGHPIHLREGMQIRNWMRGRAEIIPQGDEAHFYDNNWALLVGQAIELNRAS